MNNAIIDKVRAILDRANHPNTPQAEAETALAMAQRLMMKHGLDEVVFANASNDSVEVVTDEIVISGAWALNRLRLAHRIAVANSVASYRSTHYVKDERGIYEKKGLKIVLYGTKSDIFTVKTLFASAELLAGRLIPKGDRSFRHAWWLGFANGVGKVLYRSKNDFVREQGAGAGLVLADKYKRADNEMNAKVKLQSRSSRTTYRSGDGYSAGVSAGSSFNLGGRGVGGSAVGALGR
jgi:uncharacterized membrane protein YgcG